MFGPKLVGLNNNPAQPAEPNFESRRNIAILRAISARIRASQRSCLDRKLWLASIALDISSQLYAQNGKVRNKNKMQ